MHSASHIVPAQCAADRSIRPARTRFAATGEGSMRLGTECAGMWGCSVEHPNGRSGIGRAARDGAGRADRDAGFAGAPMASKTWLNWQLNGQ